MTLYRSTISEPPERTNFAIGMILLSVVMVASCDLATKWISNDVSLWQLQFMRSAVGVCLLIPWLILARRFSLIRIQNKKAVALRTGLMAFAYLTYFTALAKLPIAMVVGGFFTAPLFMVILSVPLLKEHISFGRAFGVIAGFAGVLLIVRPDSADFDPVTLLAVVCGFFYALVQIVTRKYCKHENPLAISYWLTMGFMLIGLAGLIVQPILPQPQEIDFLSRPAVLTSIIPSLVITVIGIASLLMHLTFTAAYQNAPSSLIAPLEYLYLPLAIAGGFIFFNEVPEPTALLGMCIIILSGLISRA